MSDHALVGLESAGVVAMLAVAWQAPKSLAMALPFVTVSMFGFWGVAEHFKSRAGPRAGSTRTAVSILQLAAGATGIAAAAIVLLGIVGRAIGTFIS